MGVYTGIREGLEGKYDDCLRIIYITEIIKLDWIRYKDKEEIMDNENLMNMLYDILHALAALAVYGFL